MCVIMMANTTRPTSEMVDKAWQSNPDGGGIAWRERNSEKKVIVRWEKGLMHKQDLAGLIRSTPLPFVAHFRVASVGGVKPELTHPFAIDPVLATEASGQTTGYVLFHNGHWSTWSERALEAAIYSNVEVPDGPWSDTRAIAWLTHLRGKNLMDLLPEQRGILFGPNDLKFFVGNGWIKINEVWCSNDYFWTKRKNTGPSASSGYNRPLCANKTCTNPAMAGSQHCYFCANEKKVVEIGAGIAAKGGAATSGSPFPLTDGLITVPVAETLQKSQIISKTLLKKVRKTYQILGTGSPKAIQKARKELELLTRIALSAYSGGLLESTTRSTVSAKTMM